MGASVQQGGGKGGPQANADINVTPLVDVMLVLLIVFMVSAPMLEQGVEINLPQAAAQQLNPPKDQEKIIVTVAIDRDERIILSQSGDKSGGSAVPADKLKDKIKELTANPNVVEFNVKGDASLKYGFLAQVLATVRREGRIVGKSCTKSEECGSNLCINGSCYKKVNLVTAPTEDQGM